MSIFRKKEISNALTELIKKNPDVGIEEVLLHRDLPETIEKNSQILYKRILLNDDELWLKKIFDYALFDKTPPKKYKRLNSIFQINKNAANFLGDCGQEFIQYFKKSPKDSKLVQPDYLQKYIIQTIQSFINEKNKINHDPMYVGHFQRFICNFLHWDAFNSHDIISELTLFIVNNCRILAYQQLATKILSDYNGMIEDEIIYNLLTQMLNHSYLAVKYIKNNKLEESESFSLDSIKYAKINKFLHPKYQPLNYAYKPIPLVGICFEANDDFKDLNESGRIPSIPWKKSVPKVKISKAKYEDVEDAEIEASLLLMSIRNSIAEQIDLINYFRDYDKENVYPLIQALLYCGTRSGIKSLVSLEAFKILSIIFNGSMQLGIKPWKSTEDEKSQFNFYNSYADEMVFDPAILTYKMIHALPVFWNHRYNEDTYKLSEEEKKEINTEDYYGDDKKHIRVREPGETALEIIQPCLLCEPPISSQLIYSCTDIFSQLSKIRRNILKNKTISKKNRNLMVKIDGTVLDFYQHHFQFGKDHPNTTFAKLSSEDIIPLPPMDKHYIKSSDIRRAPLNGFVIDFFTKMSSMRTNSYFQTDFESITEIGRCECFENNTYPMNYKVLTNMEIFSEKTKYDMPIYSDFYVDTNQSDYDDEKDLTTKNIIVLI